MPSRTARRFEEAATSEDERDMEYDGSSSEEVVSPRKIGLIITLVVLCVLLVLAISLPFIISGSNKEEETPAPTPLATTSGPTAAATTAAPTPAGPTAAPTTAAPTPPPPTVGPTAPVTAAPTPTSAPTGPAGDFGGNAYPYPWTVRVGDPPTKARSPAETAEFMNQQYVGFKADDPNSPMGLTITMVAQTGSFYKNLFCHNLNNPVMEQTSCSGGRADCRISMSLYNKHTSVNFTTGKPLLGLGRSTGYALNPELVKTRYNKCSYLWDGATNNKFNNGCGTGGGPECPPTAGSAFANQCNGHTCTENDDAVLDGFCKTFGGKSDYPPTHFGNDQCAIPGVAINFRDQPDWKPKEMLTDSLYTLMQQRLKFNSGGDGPASHDCGDCGPNIEKYTEVIVDVRLFAKDAYYDPANVVLAFIHSNDATAKGEATKMREEFCIKNLVSDDYCPPLVLIDNTLEDIFQPSA